MKKKKGNVPFKQLLSLIIAGAMFASSALGEISNGAAAADQRLNEQSINQQKSSDTIRKAKKELIHLRNAKSRTFSNGDGTYTTELSEKPIHYKNKAKNEWVPIDNKLLTNVQQAYNNSHDFKITLEKKQSRNKSLIQIKEDKYEIGLSPVENEVMTQSLEGSSNSGTVNDNVMTYKNVYPDSSLIYTLGNDRVKEDIKINKRPDMKKTVAYSFELNLNNLTYRQESNGSITLFDPSTGATMYMINQPLMYDSFKPVGYKQEDGVNSYPEEAVSYDIQYELKKKNGKLYIDVVPSSQWLNDPKRVYPVTLDPTIVKYQPTAKLSDTNIRSGFPKQTGGTDTNLGAGLYKDSTSSNIIRSLIQFDTSSIPQGAKVLTSDLNLWLASVSNDSNIDITLHGITKAWTESSATWTNADATNLWAKQGSDFDSQVSTATVGPLTSLATNYRWSVPTAMVEKWINTPSTNKGLLLKSMSETTNSYKKFISGDDTANPTYSPLLSVTYTSASRLGLEDYWTFDSHPISNGMSYTNLGTGNNVLQFTDYSLKGRADVAVDFTRTYNSKSAESSPFGYGWTYTGSETLIDAYKTSTVIFMDSDGTSHEFKYNASTGTYTPPPGKYLALSKVKDTNGGTI